MENRNNYNNFNNNRFIDKNNCLNYNNCDKKNKLNFTLIKNKTFSSLNEVECFLNKITLTKKYIKIYNLLKK